MAARARSYLVMALLCAAGCPEENAEPPFEMVLQDLDAALLSIWGTSATDVWAVGADDGMGPLVLHYDGTAWTRRATGATGDLWWVSGVGDTVWMSGTNGLVIRYDRGADAFELMTLPGAGAATLFGIIPFADGEAWTVGGDVRANTAVVYRWDGTTWNAETGVPAEGLTRPLFKVWGRESDDLWLVGLGSTAMHRTASGYTVVETAGRLLTVHGNASGAVVAVGGNGSNGYLVELDTGAVVDATPTAIQQLNGIFVRPDGSANTVGARGAIWQRNGGVWTEVLAVPSTPHDYHATWVDPDGGEWAVGGHIAAPPLDQGMLAHRGVAVGSTIIE